METVNDTNHDNAPTRQSSKLSLGSSPSALSVDEQLDGDDGPLTPSERLDDDDGLFGSAVHAYSPEPLSNEVTDIDNPNDDDLHNEQYSASPLSSVPDDFPLSRSVSPEPVDIPLLGKRKKEEDEDAGEEIEDNDNIDTVNGKKRQKQDEASPTTVKKEETTDHDPSHDTTHEETIKETETTDADHIAGRSAKRRASRATEADETKSRRKQSRQETGSAEIEPPDNASKIEESEESKESEEKKEGNNTMEANSTRRTSNNKENQPVMRIKTASTTSGETEAEAEEDQQDKAAEEGTEDEDQEYQRRHKEALEALTHIEIEFARLRDKMYKEKMAELNQEALMIANGTHPELVTLMEEIEEKKERRIRSAEAWRRYQHENFKQQFEGFEYQANVHFISQRQALRRQLLSTVNERRWAMDVERSEDAFPDGHAMLLHKREQREEVAELQDIKEAIGFPVAPKTSGLSSKDIEDDLRLLLTG
ncbi:uncharacterized protein BYT42DRAFT_614731 [Radiomyces spectabilis]|uniref:uncharacterized protein n=1 Tax=Radiomyces spectabilis TaxID=64574 RepID=UPI002220C9F4|nr:uncharacterized protein BYT42DRAFT_614731 [Radiomyces spectabilis]KAI8375936.1 hypothetical protein BYT42DRAFT_614731 [Radiomyces spectabilis]